MSCKYCSNEVIDIFMVIKTRSNPWGESIKVTKETTLCPVCGEALSKEEYV